MSRQTLKQRLDKIDCKMPPPRRTTASDDAYRRLRAVLAAEFGVAARDVWRSDGCPVLIWLRRCDAGTATPSERVLFDRIAAAPFYGEISTAAYLAAIPRVLSDF